MHNYKGKKVAVIHNSVEDSSHYVMTQGGLLAHRALLPKTFSFGFLRNTTHYIITPNLNNYHSCNVKLPK